MVYIALPRSHFAILENTVERVDEQAASHLYLYTLVFKTSFALNSICFTNSPRAFRITAQIPFYVTAAKHTLWSRTLLSSSFLSVVDIQSYQVKSGSWHRQPI